MSDQILLFQKFVPSYRVPVFRELYKKYGIITCHSRERKGSSLKSFHEKMDYPNELIGAFFYYRKSTTVVQNVFHVILKYRPKIIISEFSINYMTFWLLWILKPFFGYKLVSWSHGIKNTEILNPFSSTAGRIRLKMYGKLDAALFYSHGRKNMIEEKVKRKNHFFVAPNSLDTIEIQQNYNHLSHKTRQGVKKELNFDNEYNLVYIGRLIKEKRIDLLAESFEILVQSGIPASLHIIGDGPESAWLKEYMKKNPGIHWYGEIFDEKITGAYLYASDLLINPGYAGLNIVHAFSYGVPVLTCFTTENGPFHSPEFEYVVSGENGIVCSSDPAAIAQNLIELYKDPERRAILSEGALKTALNQCSLENMCKGFGEMIASFNGSDKPGSELGS